MNAASFQRTAATPGLRWTPRNFRFDELDLNSACVPYGEADVELPVRLWGKRIRVQGKLIASELPYRPRWTSPAGVKAFERFWQKVFCATGLIRWRDRLEKWIAVQPSISSPPILEVRLDGGRLLRHLPAESDFVAQAELPPPPAGRQTFRIGFRLRGVAAAEILAGIAKLLLRTPMPEALWNRMRDWQFRSLQHRRLRLVTIWMDEELIIDFRGHAAAPSPAVIGAVRPGLNILGHFLSESSMGDAARSSVRAADAAGIPSSLVRLRIPLVSRQGDETMKGRLSEAMTQPVSLYHIYIPETEEIETRHGAGWMSGRYNIAYWVWETHEFPKDWVRHARRFDEIWSPSDFAAEAIRMHVPVPVLTMPHVIEFPLPAGTDFRAKFGLPERMFLFLFLFDLNSLSARKNPEAVVAAFRRVAARNPAVGLVLKTHNASRNAAAMELLREEASNVANVFFLNETLARQEVYELMACCDAFVSLHHTEGFGLCVAEAMFLGKPVVSTDWSATAEYVTPQNGFPVRYRLIRLDHHINEYVRGTEWAEPDIDHAAWCMERLVVAPDLGSALGEQAASDMRARFSAAAVGRRYAKRLENMLFW